MVSKKFTLLFGFVVTSFGWLFNFAVNLVIKPNPESAPGVFILYLIIFIISLILIMPEIGNKKDGNEDD